MKAYNKLAIQSKLLLLGVLPAAIVAVTLSVYFTTTRLNDLYDLLHKTNQNLATSIAESSVNAVFTGNTEALNAILNNYQHEPNVLSIQITDAIGTTITQAHNPTLKAAPSSFAEKNIIQPIKLKGIVSSNEFDSLLVAKSNKNNDIIGYVSISIAYDSIQHRQQGILLNSFYITLTLLIIIGLITQYISNTLAKPIRGLASNVNKISHGSYTLTAIEYDSPDEISTLISGIMSMAVVIEDHQKISEHKVHLATQELRLQNNKLFSAQEALIKAARAKSKFVSHISHEIRTPLNGIIGFLEIITKTALNDEQKQLVRASLLSAKNLHIIINEVLDLAQLEAGKTRVNRSDFNLKETIENTLATLSVLAQGNDVNIEYRHDQNAPELINQDRVKLGQILLNLVGNAIKFSPNSTVIVSLRVDTAKKNQLEICIQDDGIGISERNLKKLFHAFSQVDEASSSQGTGLGLVITKHLLEVLNGNIQVKSTLGVGSIFCFYLPFSPAKQSALPLPSVEHNNTTLPELGPINVLVADDNEINRLLLTHLLEDQHAHVICANDGQQAVDLASKHDFDLMLLDLRMPFKMGNEALQEIRRCHKNRNRDTPAIAITAHITTGEERANHISAFDGYLVKPIDHAELFNLITQLLNEHSPKTTPFIQLHKNTGSINLSKVFDYVLASKSMNSDHHLMSIILNKFFTELPMQSEFILTDIHQGDFLAAAETVHKVQGSCAYCGASSLQAVAKQLEISLRNKNTTLVHNIHKKFIHEVDRLLSSKPQILHTLTASE